MENHMEDQSQEKAVLVSWSGGKDSCMALCEVQRTSKIRVEALLTTVTRDFDRISMHGVRRILTFNTDDFTRYGIEVLHPSSLLS